MERKPIDLTSFTAHPHALWDWTWFLLASGDLAAGKYNAMTVSWGALGFIWNKPLAMVVVRPTRYTFGFMNDFASFTLSAFDQSHRKALEYLGSRSGRNEDKIKASGLTLQSATQVAAPGFAEAELVLECRKVYWQDIDPSHFLDTRIDQLYNKDYHRIFFGEVVAITGTDKYTG
ncbi:MAG: flavin reductase family protein [Anaerolineae bacterium]|nr:flavin reductase family protein [Anaerolineae bacterium]